MQLVNDCVIMYDTMKDKKIGVAEVIEKFGVPPEKVIEVQALIGDSTDNVPGVPGIGVKTAAQLIGEYGDLETLLARAGEIKQEKRRQALIDNAEKARISKVLVTLDDKVKLEVPLADLAVHEPDYKRADRVPQGDGILHADAARRGVLRRRCRRDRAVSGGAAARARDRAGRRAVCIRVARPAADRRRHDAEAAPGRGRSRRCELTPQTLAAARLEAARNAKIDRARYEIVQEHRPRSTPGSRARVDLGAVAINVETIGDDPMQAALCGIALAVAPNEACYVPLAHRKAGNGDGLFGGGLAPGQIAEASALAALKPLLEDPGVLKIGQNLKFELQVFAVRGIELRAVRRHHADVLRARRRPLRPRPRRAGAALLQSRGGRLQRRDRQRQSQGRLRRRSRSSRPRPMWPRTPTSRCA